MGLFEKVFGKKTQPKTTRLEVITDAGEGFYSWEGSLYKSDVIRAAIRPKATAIGKLVAKHIRDHAGEFQINPNVQLKLLLEEPNPLMSGQVMQEKLAVQLELNNNAFAFIKRDDNGFPTDIYPLPASSVDVVEGIQGDIYLKFHFSNGKSMTVPYADIIHLRKDFNNNDFFGERPIDALKDLMEIVNTSDQGIIKAIKNSAVIKWILKFTSVLKSDDMKKAVEEFTENYLSIDKTVGGAAAADGRYDLEQVKNEAFVPDDKQLKNTIQRVYSFFNTNENIVQSKYDENEWNAYYEAQIEPVAMQLANEFTRKLFSRRERGFGNKIIFESSSLQYASMNTKMSLVQMVDRGALTPNEWRSILSLGPIENGDKPIRRLDTAEVKKGKAIEGGETNGQKQNGTKGTDNSED